MSSLFIPKSLIKTLDNLLTSIFDASIQFLQGNDFFSNLVELHFTH